MKRSHWAFAALICTALAGFMYERMWAPVAAVAHKVGKWVKDRVVGALKLAGSTARDPSPISIRLIQAKAFVLRLAKRERPELTGSWRMCPST